MSPEALFSLTGPLALAGWLALILSPLAPRAALTLAGLAIPLLLSTAYAALILAYWTTAEGGFSSLSDVMTLFDTPGVALAGWVHYLAYDLFVGAWIVRTARAEGVYHALVLPCLVPAFLFGPIGFLAFNALRLVGRRRQEIPA